MSAEKPGVIQTDDGALSECCRSDVEVSRVVHDTIVYRPVRVEDDTLYVSYVKVYEGESDGFTVECVSCHRTLDVEVEER
jgi:hypothetical protein